MRITCLSIAASLLLVGHMALRAQNMKNDAVVVRHVRTELSITSLDDELWKSAETVNIVSYWSGETAPAGRSFNARLLWSETALYVRFEARQTEDLVVSEKPDIERKTRGLWDRDVCEIFIAPDRNAPNKYYEFEIAPTGEWIDLGITVLPEKRETDWDYSSGMTSAVRIGDKSVVMAMKIPWKALGRTPKTGDVWLGNLFRCVGKDPTRGYLAWRPTKTKEPAFHHPEAFGKFEFVK